ncbi:MAG TPA: zinc-ribbon and DUF3426 domain-containing protein [Methylophilus sp.]|nr:zinc-ribbon and DUF3426 domain-containing protein [Methylophilus sp.]HQQ32313.1 zinc-ribbon and DUF3426 domain-containing protein [Methylophilus sp.]
MNYITACPECNTQFLISQEHLKAYRGKVQCGHCHHVFNAKNRLSKITEEEEAGEQAFLNTAFEEIPAEATHDFHIKPTTTPEVSEGVITVEFADPSMDSDESESLLKQLQTPPPIEDLTTEPRFATARVKTTWGIYLFGLLLVLSACMQSIYFMRTSIAATHPQFKPFLVNACSILHCKVELPKNLDLLLIDDSDMQEDETYQSVINFSSTLINHAQFAQAYPNIELTLTDLHDEPVIRKLLKPSQYLKSGTNIDNGIAGREEMHISLPLHVNDIAVAGYRVQLAY